MIPINYVAVVVAALLNMVIGALWYSPLLFAKPWMKLIGKTEEECKDGMTPKYYALAALGSLIVAYVMAHFVYLVGAHDAVSGATLGFWAWLGFLAAPTFSDYLFAGRGFRLFGLNSAYYLVVLVVMGALLASWSF